MLTKITPLLRHNCEEARIVGDVIGKLVTMTSQQHDDVEGVVTSLSDDVGGFVDLKNFREIFNEENDGVGGLSLSEKLFAKKVCIYLLYFYNYLFYYFVIL